MAEAKDAWKLKGQEEEGMSLALPGKNFLKEGFTGKKDEDAGSQSSGGSRFENHYFRGFE